MSWFKRGGESRSPESKDQSQADTDPNTCLEVFLNHWKQAWAVMSCQDKKATTSTGHATTDGVEAVLRNLEQMITLLISEGDSEGLPGPILSYALETELVEKMCAWFTINISAHEKLRMQELRLFELIISQSRQMLLIHKPVIRPLLRLLLDVAESPDVSNGELEFKLVLVLHQICLCISQQNLILESFFSTDADHGPARFLIFSLLIPYIHREGPVGQKARDALLLIMTLSARHPHIGRYIANNSDFCPVLATGLSGLYSSLPRRLTPPSDDWHAITWEDCIRIPDLQMFLNSLQFSNAVVQVAHPLVRKQLIDFIYSGFLVPVLAAALHQISREEVMTATAYLDLFIRHVTEPHLLKAVLKFVLLEKYDDVPILDSLLARISSNSHLSSVTLALFHTLIDLNCEDVMFHLVFRYLVPCTHVMVSQRRSVRDLDLYSKSAEKFLSLRPKCCSPASGQNPAATSPPTALPHLVGMSSQGHRASISSTSSTPVSTSSVLPTTSEAGIDPAFLWETSYFEYLHDARNKLEQTMRACHHWAFPYDGESPPPDSITIADKAAAAADEQKSDTSMIQETVPTTGYIELGSILRSTPVEEKTENRNNVHLATSDLTSALTSNPTPAMTSTLTPAGGHLSVLLPKEKCNNELVNEKGEHQSKVYASLENMDTFVNYLNELELSLETEAMASGQSIDKCIEGLTDLLKVVSSREIQRISSIKDESKSPSSFKTINSSFNQLEIPVKDISQQDNQAALEGITVPKTTAITTVPEQNKHLNASNLGDEQPVPTKYNEDDNDVSSVHSEQNDIRTLNESQKPPSISSTVSSTTTKKERSIPKDLPTSLRPVLNQVNTSVFSPLKSPGDVLSPFRSVLSPADEFPVTTTSSPGMRKLNYLNDPPNIGPFLSAVFARLEGMISNTLYFNLLLTGVLSRLAAYPQPLLRSFLLNHNLVFQPSVKSLIQVLSSIRQKLDNILATVKNCESLVANARQNLALREGMLFQSLELGMPGTMPFVPPPFHKPRAESISGAQSVREKKKVTLSDMIFRRSPGKEKMLFGKSSKHIQDIGHVQVRDDTIAHYINNYGGTNTSSSNIQGDSNTTTLSTWNAIYCALVLDEFLKELAALSQEHSVLYSDEGYLSS